MEGVLFSSGDVARETGMSRSALTYRIKKGVLPEAAYRVAGRRVFSESDLNEIRAMLRECPKLRPRRRAASQTV